MGQPITISARWVNSILDTTPGPTSLLRGDACPPSRTKRLKYRSVSSSNVQLDGSRRLNPPGWVVPPRWVRFGAGLSYLGVSAAAALGSQHAVWCKACARELVLAARREATNAPRGAGCA